MPIACLAVSSFEVVESRNCNVEMHQNGDSVLSWFYPGTVLLFVIEGDFL